MKRFPWHTLAPRYWLTWLGVALIGMLAWLPWRWRHGLGRQLGRWLYRRNRKRREIALINLTLCFPNMQVAEREKLALEHLCAYACALLDYSLLFFRSRRWLHQRLQLRGQEHIDQAIEAGRKVILLLGHTVWLEFAPAAIGQFYHAYGSYKPFSNPVIDWLVARSRLRDVEFVVAREEGMMKLVRALEPGRLMFFLPDEDHGDKHSVFAPFFQVSKATLTTPARLARLGKAVCLPVMAFHDAQAGRYDIVVGPALPDFPGKDEIRNATLMNAGLESLIRGHPGQYMWLLKLFRTRPEGETPFY